MIILESGFGNTTEAFIENRYTIGVNVIFSNENNKGKTLVLQGLMYSLGNDPIFPSGFNYRDYTFYAIFSISGLTWQILRKGNSFIIKGNNHDLYAESVSELKRIIKSKVFDLPTYLKEGKEKISELALFYQIFFLPQDKRDTSTVIGGGYYNKQDFYNLLYSMIGEKHNAQLSKDDLEFLINEVKSLEEDLRGQQKMLKYSKKNPRISELVSESSDRKYYIEAKERMKEISDRISENKKKRSRESALKMKLDNLIGELNSLNRDLTVGSVECGDCGSDKVVYKNKEFTFDVSNDFVRKSVISQITNEIELKDEVLSEITRDINSDQNRLERELEILPKDIRYLMFNCDDILTESQIEKKISLLSKAIEEKNGIMKQTKNNIASDKKAGTDLIKRVTARMQMIYKDMDPDGGIEFTDIFSRGGVVYSGSEGMEYYFARLVSMKIELKHTFPIIIDSFRDHELSTRKELFALKTFVELKCQVIISSTLKESEIKNAPYSIINGINGIDYSVNANSKILSSKYLADFNNRLLEFGINSNNHEPKLEQ